MSTRAMIVITSASEKGPGILLRQIYDGHLAGCGRDLLRLLVKPQGSAMPYCFYDIYEVANVLLSDGFQGARAGEMNRKLCAPSPQWQGDFWYHVVQKRGIPVTITWKARGLQGHDGDYQPLTEEAVAADERRVERWLDDNPWYAKLSARTDS